MSSDIAKVCLGALNKAKETLDDLGEEARVSVPKPGEPLTKGDMKISEALKYHFLNSRLSALYVGEEAGKINSIESPQYYICFDEGDGSFNLERGGLLPTTTVITAFNYSPDLKFKDAIFAGVMNLRNNDLWYAEKDRGCFFKRGGTETVKKVIPSKLEKLGREAFVMLDLGPCSPEEERSKFTQVYAQTWTHNVSSAGFHLAGVASGNFDAYICAIQKAHELGAGHLLLKEAGAYLVDFDGNSLDNQTFDFDGKYSIVAAGNPVLGEKIRGLIRK